MFNIFKRKEQGMKTAIKLSLSALLLDKIKELHEEYVAIADSPIMNGSTLHIANLVFEGKDISEQELDNTINKKKESIKKEAKLHMFALLELEKNNDENFVDNDRIQQWREIFTIGMSNFADIFEKVVPYYQEK